jgi:hypothetical protein
MNKNIFLTVVSLFFIFFKLFSQSEKFTIIIVRGSGLIEYANKKVILKKSFKYNIQELGNITLEPNSSAIVYNEKANLELGGNNLQKISTKETNSKLKSVKSNSQTDNFIKYLNKIYDDIENNKNSYGASLGGASRGIENKIPSFSPEDNSIILTDTVVLIFCDSNSSLVSKLTVTNQNTNEEVYNDMPYSKNISLFNLKPGNYSWTYRLQSSDMKLYEFENIFIIPDSAEKFKGVKKITEFNDYLNTCKDCFSEEIREILFKDYLKKNNFYTNVKY